MDTIVALLDEYRLLASFIGSFLFGDSVIITAAYLAGQLRWALSPILLATFAGAVASDVLWYFAGVYLAHRGRSVAFLERQRAIAAHLLAKLTGERPERALVYVKFLYGVRIAMILYAAIRGLSFWRFMLWNTLGIAAWFVVFVPAAYLAGRGVSKAFPFVGALEAGIIVLIVSFIVVRIINIWLTRNVENE